MHESSSVAVLDGADIVCCRRLLETAAAIERDLAASAAPVAAAS